VHPQSALARVVKSTVAGKMALAVNRKRRVPARTLETARLRRAERRHAVAPDAGADVGAVFMVPAGPGEWAPLSDTLASIRHYEPGAKVVVVADGATELTPELVEAQSPGATLLRPPWPTGGPPRLSPAFSWAMRWILKTYRFHTFVKIDSDALVTGHGLTERAGGRFAEEPRLGMLGSTTVRADGVPSDLTYSAWVLKHERRWSRSIRQVVGAAERNGWQGEEVHGGVYLVGRAALEALDRNGWLKRQPPWWTLASEDLWYSLAVRACGFEIGSFGAPGETIASGQGFLPIPKQQVLDDGILAIHSVRRGVDGEDEQELRRFYRAVRLSESEPAEPARTPVA
jgi:hypothetical protein